MPPVITLLNERRMFNKHYRHILEESLYTVYILICVYIICSDRTFQYFGPLQYIGRKLVKFSKRVKKKRKEIIQKKMKNHSGPIGVSFDWFVIKKRNVRKIEFQERIHENYMKYAYAYCFSKTFIIYYRIRKINK